MKAKIAPDGLWTGNDYTGESGSSDEFTISNGQATFSQETKARQVTAATMRQPVAGEDIYELANVALVNNVFPEGAWDYLFPNRVESYDYDSFLGAVARYPSFCGETGLDDLTLEETCMRELATILAHMIFETGGYRDKPATSAGYFDADTFFAGLTQDAACV